MPHSGCAYTPAGVVPGTVGGGWSGLMMCLAPHRLESAGCLGYNGPMPAVNHGYYNHRSGGRTTMNRDHQKMPARPDCEETSRLWAYH